MFESTLLPNDERLLASLPVKTLQRVSCLHQSANESIKEAPLSLTIEQDTRNLIADEAHSNERSPLHSEPASLRVCVK